MNQSDLVLQLGELLEVAKHVFLSTVTTLTINFAFELRNFNCHGDLLLLKTHKIMKFIKQKIVLGLLNTSYVMTFRKIMYWGLWNLSYAVKFDESKHIIFKIAGDT